MENIEVPRELIEKRDSLKQEAKAMEKNFHEAEKEFNSTRYNLFSVNVDIAKLELEEVLNMDYWDFHNSIMENRELDTNATFKEYYLAIVRSIGKELLLLDFLQNDGSTFINKNEVPLTFEDMVKYLHKVEYDF